MGRKDKAAAAAVVVVVVAPVVAGRIAVVVKNMNSRSSAAQQHRQMERGILGKVELKEARRAGRSLVALVQYACPQQHPPIDLNEGRLGVHHRHSLTSDDSGREGASSRAPRPA